MEIQDSTQLIKEVVNIAKDNMNEPNNGLLILSLFVGFIAGVAIRLRKLQKQENFNYKDFFVMDATSLVLTLCICFIAFISRASVVELKVGSVLIGKWMYAVFFALAMVADITVDKFVSGYEQYLDKINKTKTE